MDFFDNIDNVRFYMDMARGYDGRHLIDELQTYLSPGATVLEIGMGPGVDLDILARTYKVTGSDASQVFLDLYREKKPGADLLLLDAVTLETDRRYDAIYSNKVLHHLHREDLARSLARQHAVVRDGGILCHSFWRGSGEEEHQGLRFVYYAERDLTRLVETDWEILVRKTYREMEDDDSILLILQKR